MAFNLMRKINSSFIITLPIFKQCLVQAIQLKRQEIKRNPVSQLDEKNRIKSFYYMCSKYSNSVCNIARMAGVVRCRLKPTLNLWNNQKGIDETKQISQQIAEKRKTDSVELENMKADMAEKVY